MPQETRVVGLDVAKSKVNACIRSAEGACRRRARRKAGAALIAWLRANKVGRAVMEASGGYERSRAEALRAAGLEVDYRRSETDSVFRQGGRAPRQERSDRRRYDRLVRRDVFRQPSPTGRSRAPGDRPAVPGPRRLERAGRADRSTGRAWPAAPDRQGARRDRQGHAGRAAQARRRHRRQDQSQSAIRAAGRNHRQRAGARRAERSPA